MSAGLFGLLDDVAAIARMAAASVDDIGAAAGRATAKAAGVVIDDTAVTPQYVHGIAAERELPIIKRIAIGSLRNKLLFILPAALLLSQFVPWLLTPILMLGATYLCYEGAEKVWGRIRGHDAHAAPVADEGRGRREAHGDRRDPDGLHPVRRDHGDRAQRGGRPGVRAAAHHPCRRRPGDHRGGVRRRRRHREDGRHRPEPHSAFVRLRAEGRPRAGRRDAQAARRRCRLIGTVAMLWVGGHILLVGTDDLGWHAPYGVVHHWEEAVHHATGGVGGVLAWLVNTAASAVIGLVVGAVVVAIMHLLQRFKGRSRQPH